MEGFELNLKKVENSPYNSKDADHSKSSMHTNVKSSLEMCNLIEDINFFKTSKRMLNF